MRETIGIILMAYGTPENKEEKIGLMSMGEGNNTESKAKKVGYIVYQLF